MIAPYDHHARIGDSDEATLQELIGTVAAGERILADAYRTDGLNVGVNLGSAAGAGISDHYHVHLVPRWRGDTNFMTVAGDTRVVPEEPRVTLARLSPLFAKAGR
jgi:ATP adenylyltransferase